LIYIPRDAPDTGVVRFEKVWLGGGIRASFRIAGTGASRCRLVLYNVESLFAPADHVECLYARSNSAPASSISNTAGKPWP